MDKLKDLQEFEKATRELLSIARLIESKVGVGYLSADVRDCAKRLNEFTDKKYGNR